MSDIDHTILDIYARRVLAKAELFDVQEVFQENYSITGTPLGTKAPLLLYIINSGAVNTEGPNTNFGSPVQCVKLCKRVLDPPRNSITCTKKSKVVLDFELVLIVEFEDDTFDVLTLPKNLSSRLHYDSAITKAFVESTVIDPAGMPVIQHQNAVQPFETLVILSTGVNQYTKFEYTVNIPFTSFLPALRKCELEDPTLQSYIVLRNLTYDIDVLEQFQVFTSDTTSIWTTMVDFSLFEDIIDKIGIDQDIQIIGKPEYVCID